MLHTSYLLSILIILHIYLWITWPEHYSTQTNMKINGYLYYPLYIIIIGTMNSLAYINICIVIHIMCACIGIWVVRKSIGMRCESNRMRMPTLRAKSLKENRVDVKIKNKQSCQIGCGIRGETGHTRGKTRQFHKTRLLLRHYS